jgi:uncharacterized repeat protein (TIGR03803 family)
VVSLLAGCGSQLPVDTPGAMLQSQSSPIAAHAEPAGAWTLKELHRFKGSPDDGADPAGSLAAIRGNVYGATGTGGTKFWGTIFAINALGQERVLYSFNKERDGLAPFAGPIAVRDALYGTTFYGGTSDHGTIYELSTSGLERVLYSFKGFGGTDERNATSGDGWGPDASLVLMNGVLYGTTNEGGTPGTCCDEGCGTVFSFDLASGKESVLYRFQCGVDGEYPGDLIAAGGKLYGVTLAGGTSGCGDSQGCGTVYEIDTSGQKRTLYRFKGEKPGAYGKDGAIPLGLADVNGRLYGVTWRGGESACSNGTERVGCGTVFEIDASGVERTVHSFKGRPDGAGPNALISKGGALYGTTSGGGVENHGTIFEVTPSGKETVLQNFHAPYGGAPIALLAVKDSFYGTTAAGGYQYCYTKDELSPCGGVFLLNKSAER